MQRALTLYIHTLRVETILTISGMRLALPDQSQARKVVSVALSASRIQVRIIREYLGHNGCRDQTTRMAAKRR